MNEIEKAPIEVRERGLVLRNLEEIYRFAQYVVKSGLAPSSFKTPEQVLIAVQMGAEMSMPPMRSLQSFCVINGMARLYGDAPLALVKQSGLLESINETFEGKSGEEIAVCVVKRKEEPEAVRREFSTEDAQTAGLLNKVGPWKQYPKRMLQLKARSLALRDVFPDCFAGATIAEEYVALPEPSHEPDTARRAERKAVESQTVAPPPTQDDNKMLETCRDGVRKLFGTKFPGEDFGLFADRNAGGTETLEQLMKLKAAIETMTEVKPPEKLSVQEAEKVAEEKFGQAVADVKTHKANVEAQKTALKQTPPWESDTCFYCKGCGNGFDVAKKNRKGKMACPDCGSEDYEATEKSNVESGT